MAKKEKKDHPEKKETKTVVKIKPERESDKFTPDERTEILRIVRADVDYGETIQEDYIQQKILDLKHYNMRPPSELEGLPKKKWQSDRNLGLARAAADSYQATLLATVWNPDSIHFIANTATDIDNRTNQEKFTKWGMGEQEADAAPEVDAFVHNRIIVGSSFFKIYRKQWDEWIDKRIPSKNKAGITTKYKIETEKVTLEKGVIENIPDIDDILMPDYGKKIQELPFFIHILHLDGERVLGYLEGKKPVFIPLSVEEYKKKLYNHDYSEKKRELGEEKLKELKIDVNTMTDNDIRRTNIDLPEWYGMYTKNGKTEKYRMIVDLVNDEFLSGKPVRKINRSGKIPFVGGALCKEPGHIRGISLMQIIAPIVNAVNNVFCQKSDFQYVENCPFGFYVPAEGYTQQTLELEPMNLYPVGGEPQKNVWFPNLSRSMAWAESDIRILLELLERLIGAATYFMSRTNQSKTLGQDQLIDRNSETRFSLWTSRIQRDIAEAITMWFQLYQDYPPKGLVERVIDEDGKKLFPNLSVHTLRGEGGVQMNPDVVAGSKQYRTQLQLWAFETGQNTVWLNPQINPQGNYELVADTFKTVLHLSDNDVRRYLGERPKAKYDESILKSEWHQFMEGQEIDPPEGETAMAIQHLEGHMKQKEEMLHLLEKEYHPNFEDHLFKTAINVMKFMRNLQNEQTTNNLASSMVMNQPGGGQPGMGGGQPQPAQIPQQPGMPGVQPSA